MFFGDPYPVFEDDGECGTGPVKKAFAGFNPPAGWDANYQKNWAEQKATNPLDCGLEDEPLKPFTPPRGWDSRSSNIAKMNGQKSAFHALGLDDHDDEPASGSFCKSRARKKYRVGDAVKLIGDGRYGTVTDIDCQGGDFCKVSYVFSGGSGIGVFRADELEAA